MSGESMIPLEYRGLNRKSARRDCDDPHVNFQRVRNQRLWEDLETRRKQQAENARVADKSKTK